MTDVEKVIKDVEMLIHSVADRNMIDSVCKEVLNLLKSQPQIVRCKDCKRKDGCDPYLLFGNEDWFCADGKHK